MGAGTAEEAPAMRLAPTHHNSRSIPVPSRASSPKECQTLSRDEEECCTMTPVSEGRRVWRKSPVPPLNSPDLQIRGEWPLALAGPAASVGKEGYVFRGMSWKMGQQACIHEAAHLVPRAMSSYWH